MKKAFIAIAALAAVIIAALPAYSEDCFESREGATTVAVTGDNPDAVNVKCSKTTGGVLWWGNPYDGTVPMGPMPNTVEADYLTEEAVVKQRTTKLMFYPCSGCHFSMAPVPANNNPRKITNPNYPHEMYAPRDPKDFQHGKGAVWCLDCHNRTNRNELVGNRGENISFDQPQKLCGKCHGDILRDWRDGIHGKRTGDWTKGGKKRWWVCTECHDPHSVSAVKFQPIKPDPAPALPRRMKNVDHEKESHGGGSHGASHGTDAPAAPSNGAAPAAAEKPAGH
ncbi:MAG: hypothetical protein OEV59_06140 [Deltaproteobacteria bacterium]|nr:hypothetical protein [Deltaproteobacteria bacterium]